MKGREAVRLSCPGGAREGWWSGQGSTRNVCKLKLCPRSGSQVSASVSFACRPQQTLTLRPSCLSPVMNGPTVGNPKGGWEGIAAQALSPHPLPPAIQPLPDVTPTLGFLNLNGWVRWGLPGPARGPGVGGRSRWSLHRAGMSHGTQVASRAGIRCPSLEASTWGPTKPPRFLPTLCIARQPQLAPQWDPAYPTACLLSTSSPRFSENGGAETAL